MTFVSSYNTKLRYPANLQTKTLPLNKTEGKEGEGSKTSVRAWPGD